MTGHRLARVPARAAISPRHKHAAMQCKLFAGTTLLEHDISHKVDMIVPVILLGPYITGLHLKWRELYSIAEKAQRLH